MKKSKKRRINKPQKKKRQHRIFKHRGSINNRKITYSYLNKNRDIKEIIEKRYNILIIVVIGIMLLLLGNLFYVQIFKNEYYIDQVDKLSENKVLGSTAPRGRIYDRNHKLIVDNAPTKIIYYKKTEGLSSKEEVQLARKVGELINVNASSLSDRDLREFWIVEHPIEANKKITDKEWQKLEERKLSVDDIFKLKVERITKEELDKYNETDKEAAYIYTLMNEGYGYAEKIIKKEDISDEEYARIAENVGSLKGFNTRLDWDREYLYGSTFRAILGNVSTSESGIPYELKDYYLSRGYSLNDRVGTSYLEYQYEDILRGEKNVYEVDSNGEYKLIHAGKRGKDIVLTIDIELQKAVEEILENNLKKAKEEPNTEYYNRSFVIISDPKTGEILAMAGKQIVKKDKGYDIYDYTPGITTSPVVVGSVVKGASHIVGYNTGALKIGEQRYDTCIKIAATPIKCSWQYLGLLDDITALKHSSNTYQFNTAIKVGKGNYVYDGPLALDLEAFTTYRNTFKEFGLGTETGIDLPIESLGYIGGSSVSGHLLDFSIGQYDTYTPIQLSQYIGTIANNGNRMQPYLLKEVYNPTKDGLTSLNKKTEPVVLNKVNTKQEYLDRVKLGFRSVLEYGGTGSGFIDMTYKPAGKTGTSQSFIDTDGDGVIDKETVTTTFAAYAPYDNPKVTFTVISPDIYHYDNNSSYQTLVNMRISQEVSKKFFELYK